MLRLTLIRHAATAHNRRGLYQGGESDPPLLPEAEVAANRLGRRLRSKGVRPSTVWSSDRRRARRTAELAFPGVVARVDRRLRELDFGAFAGRSHQENLERYGDGFRSWSADPRSISPPWGERLGELEGRVRAWRSQLPSSGCVAVVAHAGPIAVLVAEALGAKFEETFAFDLKPAEAIQLWIEEPGWVSIAFVSPGRTGGQP